ncbi:unnamed protein product [Caenorhabditis auriculariae]|uniref:Mitogen-activated protein kinase kinase kinase n=1 Tax=Caenorhabditis auriculariae TaxID=2777116 RepID=A0A8S1HG08_9PELO|nr:unnamed protein product [Caenorhabditis auriculariae]
MSHTMDHHHGHIGPSTPSEHSMMMHAMSFHFSSAETILFDIWTTKSALDMALSCLAVVFLALVMETARFFRGYRRVQYELRQTPPPVESRLSLRPQFRVFELTDAVLQALQLLLAYCLMLIFMTFNVFLCGAVVLGEGKKTEGILSMNDDYQPYVNLAPPLIVDRSKNHLILSSDNDERPESTTHTTHLENSTVDGTTTSLIYIAAYEYIARKEDELTLTLGATIRLISTETSEEGWFIGELNGKIGLFPSNYVNLLGAESELKVFAANFITYTTATLEHCKIGSGSTATVHKVRCEGKKAALKRFTDASMRDPAFSYEVIKREAMMLNGLCHPNIVRLLGVCLEQPYVGLMLELCEGNSLRNLYKSYPAENMISMRVLINWTTQIASGMEYLISQGYVHRDLKADNILVVEEVCTCLKGDRNQSPEWCSNCKLCPLHLLTLKITDFGGTRKITTDIGARQSIAGTYAWLAPEAFRDALFSEASDVWSFGVLLWELLSKQEPFHGVLPIVIAFQVSMKGQRLALAEDWPEKWKSIMQRCWEIEPELRPSFKEIVHFFEEYKKDTMDSKISNALEEQLRRVQSVIERDIERIYTKCSTDQQNELQKLIKTFYERRQVDPRPEAKARKRKNKLQKSDIGPVAGVQHLVSFQKAEGSDVNVQLHCDLTGGTLPRRNSDSASSTIKSTLSASSPNLHALFDVINGGQSGNSSLRRQDAFRKKSRPSISNVIAGDVTPTTSGDGHDACNFAKIDSAEDLTSPQRQERGYKTFAKMLSKFHPKKSNRRDSKEEEESSRGSVSSRASSSSRLPIPLGQHTRGPAAVGFLEVAKRGRAISSSDCSNFEESSLPRGHKVSPSDGLTRPPMLSSYNSYDGEIVKRPSKLAPMPQKKSPIELDQPFPASPDTPEWPFGSPSVSKYPCSASTDNFSYELLVPKSANQASMAYERSKHLNNFLSRRIPPSPEVTHYEMVDGRPPRPIYGGGLSPDSPYYSLERAEAPLSISSARNEIRNAPYTDMPARVNGRTLSNPQYIHCPSQLKKEFSRPSTLNFNKSGTPNSTGVSTAGSTYSLLSDPPEIHAPPPPLIPVKLPPVIPLEGLHL